MESNIKEALYTRLMYMLLSLEENNVADVLELHLSYSSNESERNLSLTGKGKWRDFNLDEL